MKFNGSIDIKLPREKVVELFTDPNNLKEWQDGFVGLEVLSGEEGADGSKTKLFYQTGKRKMELIETITANRLPDAFEAEYHHVHMDNTLKVTFTALSENETRYDIEGEYTAVRGFVPKILMKLFPGMFKKQPQKWMDNFKAFAERQ